MNSLENSHFHYYFFFFEVKFTSHEIKVNNSVAFSAFTVLCGYHLL